jgi:hypothetical protein
MIVGQVRADRDSVPAALPNQRCPQCAMLAKCPVSGMSAIAAMTASIAIPASSARRNFPGVTMKCRLLSRRID